MDRDANVSHCEVKRRVFVFSVVSIAISLTRCKLQCTDTQPQLQDLKPTESESLEDCGTVASGSVLTHLPSPSIDTTGH